MAGRREERAARRQILLTSVMETFAARGFQGAGIAEIAAAGGVAPANLYRYFASKDEMVRAIVVAQRAEIAALLTASLAAAGSNGGSPRVALRHFLTAVTAQAAAPPMRALWLEILAEAARNPRIAALLREDDQQLTAAFAALVQQGIRAGEIPAGHTPPGRAPQAMARIFIALMDGAMARAAYDPGFDPASFIRDAEAMLLQRDEP